MLSGYDGAPIDKHIDKENWNEPERESSQKKNLKCIDSGRQKAAYIERLFWWKIINEVPPQILELIRNNY